MAYYKVSEYRKPKVSPTSEDKVLKLLKDTNSEKAAGIDNLSGSDGAVVLALPISKLYNLSMKRSEFPLYCKIATIEPL